MAHVQPVSLAAAVSNAGALGSIAGAPLSPDALRAAIRETRGVTDRPFAVNLFAPLPRPEASAERIAALQALLAPHRTRAGLGPAPEPQRPAWSFDDQLAVVLEERPAVFSSTFGPIDPAPLREAGIVVIGTATTVAEAQALEATGVDAVVVQSAEAGGHRGTFLGSFEESLVPLAELLPAVVAAVSVPVLAAGGIVDGAGIAAALAAGAGAVQLGTAFLFTPECAAPRAWLDALRQGDTVVTPAYSGRPGRAARTPFITELAAAGRAAAVSASACRHRRPRDGRRLRLLSRRHRRAAGARASGARARAHARRRDGSGAALSLDAADARTPSCS